jgi:hypothetical protein
MDNAGQNDSGGKKDLERLILSSLLILFLCLMPYQTYAAGEGKSLILESEYETSLLSPYNISEPDNGIVYSSKGYSNSNHAVALTLLTGYVHEIISDLPSSTFQVRAVSEKYILTDDGIYNRISIYDKQAGKRLGTLRLADHLIDAKFDNDTLYLVQSNLKDNSLILSRFTLPKLTFIRENVLHSFKKGDYYNDLQSLDKILFVKNKILFFHRSIYQPSCSGCGFITELDYDGKTRHEVSYPINAITRDGCGTGVTILDSQYLLVRKECGLYSVFSLDHFQFSYDVSLPDDVYFAPHAFRYGNFLYLFIERRPTSSIGSDLHYDVEVYNFESGAPVASLAGLTGKNLHLYKVDDRLIAATNVRPNVRISIYKVPLM